MALCESQLDSALPQINSSENETSSSAEVKNNIPNVSGRLSVPLAVDYRSPRSHFVPPEVELYSLQARSRSVTSPQMNNSQGTVTPTHSGSSTSLSTIESNTSGVPVKRKRGRPRVDKTSPEYIAKSAARKQAKEMVAMMNSSGEMIEKRKRGRPRVDKTCPEYLARKRARELEALERKAKRQNKRRETGDSAASSSTDTPRTKRKYTKKNAGSSSDTPSKRGRKKKLVSADGATPSSSGKGKRGRPRKNEVNADGYPMPNSTPKKQQPRIRVRSNLMPINTEPIAVDSDEEVDLGSPGHSDSLSLDENLRAIRHLHEKYANIGKDDQYGAHLLAANFKKPQQEAQRDRDQDEVVSLRSTPVRDSVNNNSDDSSTEGSSSSGSSSSSSSGSSSSSDSSDTDSDVEVKNGPADTVTRLSHSPSPDRSKLEDDRSYGAWSYTRTSAAEDDSSSDPERSTASAAVEPAPALSESDNESPDKSFQCNVCHKWYSTIVTLKIHRRVHVSRSGGASSAGRGSGGSRARGGSRYECDCCDLAFSRREKLLEHRAAAHRGDMTVRCEVCRKCFHDDDALAAHLTTHTHDDRAGRCSICGARYPRYEQLRRHRAAAHGERSPHSAHAASTGNNATATGGVSQQHACAQCGKSFTHAHSLTRHMHNHAKQLYRCVVCKASFARADQLAQHLNSHLANYKRLKP